MLSQVFEFWMKYWQLVKPQKRVLFKTFAWIGITQVFMLAGPFIFKLVLDEFQSWDSESLNTIWMLTGAMLVAELIVTGFNNIKYRNIFRTCLLLERDIPLRCMKRLLELSYGYHLRENTGSKMGKITRGTWRALEITIVFLFDVLPNIFDTVLVFMVLFVLSWKVSLVFLLVLPVYVFQVWYIERTVGPMRRLRFDRYEEADHKMTQAMLNVQSVQAFVQERREYSVFHGLKKLIFADEFKEWLKQINFDWYRAGAVNLGKVAILAAGVHQVVQDNITIGTLVLFLILSTRAYDGLHNISRMYERIVDAGEGVNRLYNIINEPVEIASSKGARRIRQLLGRITLDQVHFCYPNTSCGLHGVNLEIKPGETLGVCGPSGGGKSTLARLVPRFYDVCSGHVRLDGHDIRDLDLSFRRHIAIVPQEVEIFDGTVAENIAYAKPGATKGEIRRAAKIANVDEFVDKLEDGYNTKVGERGLKLSGGQRQRVGIARAILADPAVLILDEATSHLDPISENLIHDSIAKLKGSLTMIIIAHRLSTIQNADRITVLEDGKIVEEGTHQALLDQGGLYTKLANTQNGH